MIQDSLSNNEHNLEELKEDVQRKFADIVDPEIFENEVIHIIGVGATGSLIANLLCRFGFEIHVYDFDDVETKNTYNQYYRFEDVGKQKVYALASRLNQETGGIVRVVPHNEKVTDASNMSGIIITTVDSIDSRKAIGLSLKEFKFLLDPGIPMNVEELIFAAGRVRLVLPNNIDEWLQYYDDDSDEQMKARLEQSVKGCEAQQYSLLCHDVATQTAKIVVSLVYCLATNKRLTFDKGYIVSGAMPGIVSQTVYN